MTELYVLQGTLKHGEANRVSSENASLNDHLAQWHPTVKLFGQLYDFDGNLSGFFGVIEADSLEQAQHYQRENTFARAGMIDAAHMFVLKLEVGSLR